MGNQREILQVEPLRTSGAVLRVRPDCRANARSYIEAASTTYYCQYISAGKPVAFSNLDKPETRLPPQSVDCVIIQSGGKMWCGYDNFVTYLRGLAAFVEDAIFYVADESDYIDAFSITGGDFRCERVHEGSWVPIDEFLLARESSRGDT